MTVKYDPILKTLREDDFNGTLTNATTDNTISVDQNGNVGTAVATDGAIHIENTGNTGIGLGVYSNIGATADAPLVSIHADNVAFDQDGVKITYDGTEAALFILTSNTNGKSIEIQQDGGNNHAVYVSSGGNIYGVGLVALVLKNPNDVGDCLLLSHAGTHANGGSHINFAGDPPNTTSADGDFWFDGTNLKINVGGTVYNIDKTAV